MFYFRNHPFLISLSIIFLCSIISCTSRNDAKTSNLLRNDAQTGNPLTVEMRENLSKNVPITFSEEITRVEYVPLELTDDGASALAESLDISVTDEYIFVYSMKVNAILQFSRMDGKFIRQFATLGGGPDETQLIVCFYADETARRIYVVQHNNILEFTFDGTFIVSHPQTREISYQYPVGDNLIAEVGRERVPFSSPNLIGMGVFKRNGDTIAVKNNFARPDIFPANASCIKDVLRAFSGQSLLYFIGSNDTVFRLTSDAIQPAFVLNRKNSRKSLEGALHPRMEAMQPNDFWIYDFFETSKSFYVRSIFDEDKMYIFALDKATNLTTTEISGISPQEIFGFDRWMLGIGIHIGDEKIPLWPTKTYLDKNILVQYMPAPEIFYLKEKGVINKLPTEIEFINEESNPIVIIYHLE